MKRHLVFADRFWQAFAPEVWRSAKLTVELWLALAGLAFKLFIELRAGRPVTRAKYGC